MIFRWRFIPLVLLSLFLISGCTSTQSEHVKYQDDKYYIQIALRNPRKKPLKNVSFELWIKNNGSLPALSGEYKVDNAGVCEISISKPDFEKGELWIIIPDQKLESSDSHILPYRYPVINKDFYTVTVLVPFTEEYLKNKDTYTRLLFTRRVLINYHQEWSEEIVSNINSGDIKEGMTVDMVRASMGEPQNRTQYYSGNSGEIWTYFINSTRSVKVYFDNGKVVEIERTINAEEPPPPVFGY